LNRPFIDVYFIAPSLFFFHATPTTKIYTLSLHDALPIYDGVPLARAVDRLLRRHHSGAALHGPARAAHRRAHRAVRQADHPDARSEEHTSETPVTWPSRMPSSA